jgi:hypothetical protein
MQKSLCRIPKFSAGVPYKKAIANAMYGHIAIQPTIIIGQHGPRWAVSFGENDRFLAILIGCTRRWGFWRDSKHFPTPYPFPSRTAFRRPAQRG